MAEENKQLQIKCRFHILSIHRCTIHARYGDHTRAKATVVVEGEKARAAILDIADEKIEIICVDNDTAVEQILFSGIIDDVELIEDGGYAVLNLSAVSHTWKMDIQKRSRSFQNLSMTYRDIAQTILREYGAFLIWNASDKQLEYPLIQYKETDYQFLMRILSHLQEGITAGDFSSQICIYAGVRDGDNKGNIILDQYAYSVKPFLEKKAGNMQRTGYKGYHIHDMDFVRVGDRMQIHSTPLYVMDTDTIFAKGCLTCSCLAFPRQCFKVSRIPAKTLELSLIQILL
ncbi:MAG: phage late control D family protein, partial [Lachnospiraceae bacterium]|nr:phage late control D family protein [Lachnospiraceae bacterium]